MTFAPLYFVKDGVTATANTIAEYYQYLFDGWSPLNPPPPLPRDQINASLADIDEMMLELVDVLASLTLGGNPTGLTLADIADSPGRFALTAAMKARLEGIEPAATRNETDDFLRNRANHTGKQDTSTIDKLTEFIEDTLAAILGRSTHANLVWNYVDNGDGLGTLSASAGAGNGSGLDAEGVRDAIALALVGVNGITVVPNDSADTITFSVSGLTISQTTGLQDALDARMAKTANLGDVTDKVVARANLELYSRTQVDDFIAAITARVSALDGQGGLPPATPPTAPQNLKVTSTLTSVSATWAAPESTGGSPITGYRAVLAQSGQVIQEQTLPGTTHSFIDLPNGTAYTFTLTAINAIGSSNPSSVPITTLTPATVPGSDKPTATIGAVTPTSLGLDWSDPASPAAPIVARRFGWDTSSNVQAGVVRIMPAGDSLTAVDNSALGYKGVVLDQLIAAGKQIDYVGPKVATGPTGLKDFQHYGVPGAQNSTFLGQYLETVSLADRIKTYDPHILTYLAGVNDLRDGVAVATALQRLRAVMDAAYVTKPDLKIVLMRIPLMGISQESLRPSYNAGVSQVASDLAAAGKDITLVDLSNTLSSSDLQGDGVHWVSAGHTKVANALYPSLLTVVNSVSGAAVQSWNSGEVTGTAPDPYVFTGLASDTLYSLWMEVIHAASGGGTTPTPVMGPLDFTGSNGAGLPTQIGLGFGLAGSSLTIQGNKAKISTRPAVGSYDPNDRVVILYRNSSGTAYNDATKRIRQKIRLDTPDSRKVLFLSSQLTNDSSGQAYCVNFWAGQPVSLVRNSGYNSQPLGEIPGLTPVVGTEYEVDYSRDASGNIKLKVWTVGSTEPSAPQISVKDNSPLPAGYHGIHLIPGGTVGQVYSFSIDDVTLYDTMATGSSTYAGQRVTLPARTNPASTTPTPVPSTGGMPTGKWFGIYLNRWGGPGNPPQGAIHLSELMDKGYNYAYGFVAWSAQAGTGKLEYSPNYSGDTRFISDVNAWKAAGKKILLSIGGGGNDGLRLTNATQVAEMVSTLKAIIDKYGFQGIDWDIESETYATATAIRDVSKALKDYYGAGFIIAMVPRGYEIEPFKAAQLMQQMGILDVFAMQFYDNPAWETFSQGSSYMRNYVNKAVNQYGIPASKIVLGFIGPGYSGSGEVSVALANQYWNDIKAIHPTLRGMMVYDSSIEKSNNFALSPLRTTLGL